MWDNRSLVNRSNIDFAINDEPRVLQRTVVAGAKPY